MNRLRCPTRTSNSLSLGIRPCVTWMASFLGTHAQTSTHSKEGTEAGQCMDTTKGFIGVIYKTMDEGLIREQKELQTASRVAKVTPLWMVAHKSWKLVAHYITCDSSIGCQGHFLGSSGYLSPFQTLGWSLLLPWFQQVI